MADIEQIHYSYSFYSRCFSLKSYLFTVHESTGNFKNSYILYTVYVLQ
jgi:hypothetical protein